MNDIMYARYLESLNHRLNETLDIIKEHLPVEELEYDQCGKPIFPCCWPLVKILIEINVTAKKLQEGEPETKDDTDDRYNTKGVILNIPEEFQTGNTTLTSKVNGGYRR